MNLFFSFFIFASILSRWGQLHIFFLFFNNFNNKNISIFGSMITASKVISK